MRPVEPRLLRHARAARGYLVVTAALGVVTTGMVIAQAELLARLLAGAARGTGPAAQTRGFNLRRSGRPPEKRGWAAYYRATTGGWCHHECSAG